MEKKTEEKKLRFVSIEGCEEVGHGKRGAIYQIGEDRVVKVFFDLTKPEEIEMEWKVSSLLYEMGVTTAKIFDIVETEKGLGIVAEYAGYTPLGSYMHENPEKMEECMKRFTKMLHEVHDMKVKRTDVLCDYKERYRKAMARFTGFFSEREIKSLIEIVDAIPDSKTLLHGDSHPQNMMLNKAGELRFIDLADAGYGHPIFDVGGFQVVVFTVKNKDWKGMQLLGMTDAEARKMWGIFLREYYQTDDPKFLKRINKTCEYFGQLRLAELLITPTIGGDLTEKEIKMGSLLVKINLLWHKRNAIKLFKQL